MPTHTYSHLTPGTGTIGRMTTTPRRPRGTDTVQLHVRVRPEVKERLDQIADQTGLPMWAVVEGAALSGTPNEHGIPEGWNLPTPSTDPLPFEQDTRKTA